MCTMPSFCRACTLRHAPGGHSPGPPHCLMLFRKPRLCSSNIQAGGPLVAIAVAISPASEHLQRSMSTAANMSSTFMAASLKPLLYSHCQCLTSATPEVEQRRIGFTALVALALSSPALISGRRHVPSHHPHMHPVTQALSSRPNNSHLSPGHGHGHGSQMPPYILIALPLSPAQDFTRCFSVGHPVLPVLLRTCPAPG
jgi:hypothetical protein